MGQWLKRSREGFSFLKWQILKDGENSEEGEINDIRGNDCFSLPLTWTTVIAY